MRTWLSILFLVSLSACGQKPPTVQAGGELLEGLYVEDGRVAAFLGVPFAEPPIGERRWRGPQPLAEKQEVRKTTAFAPACMQQMRILDWYRYMAETFGGSRDYYDDLEVSEDCLYLNIWTPTLSEGANLPVMVWIHGGSNDSGWAYELSYHGHNLAQRGVVVVSVAYRVGVFGFLSHPDLDRNEPVANFGLWDIVAALEWLQRNIGQFGGDADRVMLFGESAGAQDILALMAADPADGLFQRAALQSNAGYGLPGEIFSLGNEERRARHLATHLGIDENESLGALRALPAQQLLDEYDGLFANYYHSPAIDGQLITEATWESVRSGDFGDRQIIIGTNRDEWLDFIGADADAKDLFEAARGMAYIDGDIAMPVVREETDPRRAMDRLITADQMLCPSQATAAHWSANDGDAWVYFFTRIREDEGGRKIGAYHGAEYPYVFNTHDDYMTTTTTDVALTEAMQTYWVQFAATGDPNADTVPQWPRFRGPDFPVQELGDTVRTISAPEPELCRLFEPD